MLEIECRCTDFEMLIFLDRVATFFVLTHAKRNCRHPSQPHRKLRFPDQISFNHIAGMDQRTLEEEKIENSSTAPGRLP